MKFLISVIDTAESANTDAATAASEMSAVDVFNQKLEDNGHWVYANGLAAPESATVVDNRADANLVIDGPFVESKEYIGGLWIIEAKNRKEAVALATEGSKACNRKVEVRSLLTGE